MERCGTRHRLPREKRAGSGPWLLRTGAFEAGKRVRRVEPGDPASGPEVMAGRNLLGAIEAREVHVDGPGTPALAVGDLRAAARAELALPVVRGAVDRRRPRDVREGLDGEGAPGEDRRTRRALAEAAVAIAARHGLRLREEAQSAAEASASMGGERSHGGLILPPEAPSTRARPPPGASRGKVREMLASAARFRCAGGFRAQAGSRGWRCSRSARAPSFRCPHRGGSTSSSSLPRPERTSGASYRLRS